MKLSNIKIKLVEIREGFAPKYKHHDDAGADLRANLGDGKTLYLPARTRQLVPAGFKVELPEGKEMQIRPRSGLALNKGLTVLNAPGTIDGGYRDEVGIILYNSNPTPYVIEDGERIAQAVIADYYTASWELVDTLDENDRGGGFGSTGV